MERNLKDLDFFEIKLLKNKQGTFYFREGKIFIYQGKDKLNIDVDDVFTIEGNQILHFTEDKDFQIEGHFYFWQKDNKYILNFISGNRFFLLKGGVPTDSIIEDV